MKRFCNTLVAAVLAAALLIPGAMAAGDSGVIYDLSVNGSHNVTASTGETVTVTFAVTSGEEVTVSTLQNEVYYDTNFFELVSCEPGEGSDAEVADQQRVNGDHVVQVAYWGSKTITGSTEFAVIRLKVIAASGSSTVASKARSGEFGVGAGVEAYYDGAAVDITPQSVTVTIGGSVGPGVAPEPDDTDDTAHDCPSAKFTDFVASAWYHEAVDYVVVNGWFIGTSETTFEPDTAMTRAMFVQVLANMSGANLSEYTSSTFTDVDTGAWYAPAVEWAYRNGIVDGVGDGLFAPEQEITREQMAKMLRDYAAFTGADVSNTDETGLSAFADSADVSDWAVEAVAWAVNNSIINGTDKGLEPLNNATRAEVAQILLNYDLAE